jgi:hypothetical protein
MAAPTTKRSDPPTQGTPTTQGAPTIKQAVEPITVRARTGIFTFPNPVNEHAARVVAAGVAILALTTLVTGWLWLIPVLAVGFAARTASGPRFSLLGRLATQLIAPRLGPPNLVPGPPKRFAQAIGLTLTTVASIAAYALEAPALALGLVAVLLVFACLESIVGLCAGCWLFGLLMRAGVIPDDVCEQCRDVRLRYAADRSPSV